MMIRIRLKTLSILLLCCLFYSQAFSWGFYAHRLINYHAVFLLPPQMMIFYKPHAVYLKEHAVDPDKRRYIMAAEAPRHYIDIDHYGPFPYATLPPKWKDAVRAFTSDTLNQYGIVPWHTYQVLQELTNAFRDRNCKRIIKLSADLGHYVGDAHVPLHANSNHNGQLTHQEGIHALWESRIPELLAEQDWNLFTGKAGYISYPQDFIWQIVYQSGQLADSVLLIEKKLEASWQHRSIYAFEEKNTRLVRQYASAYVKDFNLAMNGMVERRLQQSILATASLWFTAWVNAGQPDLTGCSLKSMDPEDEAALQRLNNAWRTMKAIGRPEPAE